MKKYGEKDRLYFKDSQEIAAFAEANPFPNSHARTYGNNSEFCGYSFADSISAVKNGWPEGVKEIDYITSQIEDAIESNAGYGLRYDVSGDYIDVGAYLEGVPECFGQIVSTDGPRQTINVIASATVARNVSPEAITNRGAAITALISQLQKQYFVNVRIINSATNIRGSNTTDRLLIELAVDTTEHFCRNTIAAALAHPGYLRRVTFSVMEIHCKNEWPYGYGRVDTGLIPDDDKDVIFFGGLVHDGPFETVKGSIAEVQRILDKYTAC